MRRANDFSPSSSWTITHAGNTPGNPSLSSGDGYFGWDHHAVIQNTRSGTPVTDYRPFEERVPFRPSRVTSNTSSIPMDPYSRPTRIIIVNNHLDHGINPRLLHQFTRRPVVQGNWYVPPTETDESKLTKEEQETVLNSLHRQTYNHVPKMSRRISLYYRDLNRDANARVPGKTKDDDGKNCAVCLEDFENGEEVMVTRCKHMFHEECIVPWVKDHEKCPVCRSDLCDGIGKNRSDFSRNRDAVMPADDGLFSHEILSLIRAVDEAFVLGG